jgi:hypothetical protein
LEKALTLDVAAWAAIVTHEMEEPLGAAEEANAIPPAQRRRLPAFTRDVLRCTVPLLRDRPRCPVVLASPHGDLASTVTLLTDVVHRQILSPSLFGLSVHNAPTGALSLCLDAPGDQTALAGDAGTLSVGLMESYARLATGEAPAILLCHAEARLPPAYAEFDEDAPGVVLAMVLRLSDAAARPGVTAGPGRAGVVDVARALAAGASRISCLPPRAEALAA